MPETPYDLPDGARVWVIDTPTAAHNLPTMLESFRKGEAEPLIFGDNGKPEAVVISWDDWARLDALRADAKGFDHAYDVARRRVADSSTGKSVPVEDVAEEFGWDPDEFRPKPDQQDS